MGLYKFFSKNYKKEKHNKSSMKPEEPKKKGKEIEEGKKIVFWIRVSQWESI